jgi:phosphoglycolate phosphatase
VIPPNSQPLQAVLFDLDGTLIDHFRIIHRSYAWALTQMGIEPASYDKVRASVGGSIVITFGKLVEPQFVARGVELFRQEFDRIWHEDIGIYPGAERLLRHLRGMGLKVAVLTNKEGDRARKLLHHTGLANHLDAVFGTLDTPWRKPQPEFTQFALDQLGVAASAACLVGDSPYDVDTALAAGLPCYAVATGSHSRAELQQTAANAVFTDLVELGGTLWRLPADG